MFRRSYEIWSAVEVVAGGHGGGHLLTILMVAMDLLAAILGMFQAFSQGGYQFLFERFPQE